MAVRDIFKFSRKTFFNPAGWLDFDFLFNQTATLYVTIRNLFIPPKPEREETFEQSLTRMNLTEAEADQIKTSYRLYALIFLLVAVLCFAYSFYLLFSYGAILPWMLGIAVTALLLAKAFQFDFWAYQIKRRKLGVTMNEWFDALFGKEGGSA